VRVRMGIIVVALGLSLSACSDDPDSEPESNPDSSAQSDSPDAADTEVGNIDCPEYQETAQKIIDTQAQLFSPDPDNDPAAAIDELNAELEALKEGAPPEIQEALTGLSASFGDAAEILEDPNGQNQTKLLELATKLSEAGQKVTTYIAEQCEAS